MHELLECETANAAMQRMLKSESKFAPLVLKLDFIFQETIIYKHFSRRSIWQSEDQETISRIHPISFIIIIIFELKYVCSIPGPLSIVVHSFLVISYPFFAWQKWRNRRIIGRKLSVWVFVMMMCIHNSHSRLACHSVRLLFTLIVICVVYTYTSFSHLWKETQIGRNYYCIIIRSEQNQKHRNYDEKNRGIYDLSAAVSGQNL